MTDSVIASTKDRPGSYDAIETAKPGEPLFPIQGGDPFGPPTVLYWAGLARQAGMAELDERRADHLLRKASDAEQVAWTMQRYQRGGDGVPDAVSTSYTGYATIPDPEADAARSAREARIRGAERLHDIVARGADIADALDRHAVCESEVAALRVALDRVKAAAFAIEPRRGGQRS